MPGGTAQYPGGRIPRRTGRRPIGGVFPCGMQVTVWPFQTPKFYGSFNITGVTRDSTGVALGSCSIDLFESATDIRVANTISDGSGNFSFVLGNNSGTYYIVAYKAGAPDLAGTSVNTLAPVAT